MGGPRYLVGIAAALALVACGDDDAPDVQQVTKELAHDVQEQTGTQDVQVICSSDVSEGDLCDVQAPGGLKAKVRVTRLDGDDIEGEIVQP